MELNNYFRRAVFEQNHINKLTYFLGDNLISKKNFCMQYQADFKIFFTKFFLEKKVSFLNLKGSILKFDYFFQGLVENQKREIDELKSKITQVLAVMPSDSFTSPPSSSSSSLSRIRLSTESTLSILQQQSSQPQSQSQQSQSMSNSTSSSSNLDPNAVAYTPKSSMTTSTGES